MVDRSGHRAFVAREHVRNDPNPECDKEDKREGQRDHGSTFQGSQNELRSLERWVHERPMPDETSRAPEPYSLCTDQHQKPHRPAANLRQKPQVGCDAPQKGEYHHEDEAESCRRKGLPICQLVLFRRHLALAPDQWQEHAAGPSVDESRAKEEQRLPVWIVGGLRSQSILKQWHAPIAFALCRRWDAVVG
jgi:hypothetical protein